MRNRIIVAATAVATGLAILPATPVFAEDKVSGVTAQAGTMAERSNPHLVGIPEVLDGYARASWGGIASDAEISSVSVTDTFGNASDYSFAGGLYIRVSDPEGPVLGLNGAASEDGTVQVEHQFVIVYTDGSIDRTSQKFVLRAAKMKDAYHPYFENPTFEPGKTQTRELRSLPEGSRLTVISAPEGWDVEPVGPRSIEVTPNNEAFYTAQISVVVSYPDGSSETVHLPVGIEYAQPQPWTPDEPEQPPAPERPSDPPALATTTVTSTVTQPASTERVTSTVTQPASPERVTSTVPTTVVSTVNGTPVTVTSERTVISEVPVTEKTVVIETPEPSSSQRALPIVTVILALVGAIGGVFATLLNFPAVRALLPF